MTDPVLALDVGGTKLAAAIVAADGTILHSAQIPTAAIVSGCRRTGEEIFADFAALLTEVAHHPDLPQHPRVGISSAGPLSVDRGTISPVNIPGWRDFPLLDGVRDALTQAERSPSYARLIGDGHCVALGEWWLGAGRDQRSVIGCIVSTGIGAGVVVDGQAYEGTSGSAVHVGHSSVDMCGEPCVCGSRGCVETYASGPSMVRRAQARGFSGTDAIQLTDAADAGDPHALAAIDEGMRALGAGLAGLVTLFDVPTVIVGGGVSKAGDTIFAPLRRWFGEFVHMPYVKGQAEIRQAELSNASLMGAAYIALPDDIHAAIRAAR